MIITVYNSKGGVGKTPIAANFLFDNEDWIIATNELNSGFAHIESIDESRKILISPEDEFNKEVFTQGEFVENNYNMIIDLSGSLAKSIKSVPTALEISDVVIVPINYQQNSILQGITTIQSINENYPDLRVVVIVTKIEKLGVSDVFGDDWTKSKSFVEIKDIITETTNNDIDFFPLKYSRGYENLIKEEVSLKQLASRGFGGHAYKIPAKQFEEIYRSIGV